MPWQATGIGVPPSLVASPEDPVVVDVVAGSVVPVVVPGPLVGSPLVGDSVVPLVVVGDVVAPPVVVDIIVVAAWLVDPELTSVSEGWVEPHASAVRHAVAQRERPILVRRIRSSDRL